MSPGPGAVHHLHLRDLDLHYSRPVENHRGVPAARDHRLAYLPRRELLEGLGGDGLPRDGLALADVHLQGVDVPHDLLVVPGAHPDLTRGVEAPDVALGVQEAKVRPAAHLVEDRLGNLVGERAYQGAVVVGVRDLVEAEVLAPLEQVEDPLVLLHDELEPRRLLRLRLVDRLELEPVSGEPDELLVGEVRADLCERRHIEPEARAEEPCVRRRPADRGDRPDGELDRVDGHEAGDNDVHRSAVVLEIRDYLRVWERRNLRSGPGRSSRPSSPHPSRGVGRRAS